MQKTTLDEGQCVETMNGMDMGGENEAQPDKKSAIKEDSGLEVSSFVEKMAQKPMGQRDLAQNSMVWTSLKGGSYP